MVVSNQGKEEGLGNMDINQGGVSLHPGLPFTLCYRLFNISHGIVTCLIG